ncbi:MAG: c-type cytochrome [Pirellulales bacterium]|nr:c-type cytochrome [Pirellulales bacterium]
MRIRKKVRLLPGPSNSDGWSLLLTLLLASFAAGCGQSKPTAPAGGASPSPKDQSSGAAKASVPERPDAAPQTVASLYGRHCAACHGEKGDGKGIAAVFLYPKPRDFRAGNFRLVSTANNVPTIEDLEGAIARGMPGSAMPPWEHLSAGARRELAEYVMQLRRDGAKDIELAIAAEEETERTPEELEEAIAPLITPGPMIEVPPLPPSSAEAIERGRELYKTKGCAACHGNEGRGDGQQQMIDTEGFATRPRDLTRGLYKGDPDPVVVYRRILAGMPGTPMPSLRDVEPAAIADLTHFVLSLSDQATRDATVAKRQQISAGRVPRLPQTPDDTAWQAVSATRLLTMPLWWRDDPHPWVDVQAVHDGQSLAIRLTWDDATHDDGAVRADEFEDMAAVELYQGNAEPFLGMGSKETPIELWQWRAGTANRSAEDFPSDDYPFDEPIYRQLLKGQQLPDFITARAAGNPLATRDQSGADLVAGGLGSTTFRPKASQVVQSAAVWKDGRWNVMLSRPLQVAESDGQSLQPAERYSLAAALWDGAAHDRGPQKRISLWNDLKID